MVCFSGPCFAPPCVVLGRRGVLTSLTSSAGSRCGFDGHGGAFSPCGKKDHSSSTPNVKDISAEIFGAHTKASPKLAYQERSGLKKSPFTSCSSSSGWRLAPGSNLYLVPKLGIEQARRLKCSGWWI